MSEATLAAAPPAAAGRRRGQDTRERLLEAARACFCEAGYAAVTVEDIAAAAGVTRMTLYRHVPGKAALAIELYERTAAAAMPRLLAIAGRDFRDPAQVRGWIAGLFEADRAERRLLRAFNQAAAIEPVFVERAQAMIGELIVRLGRNIPAFAVRPDVTAERPRWLEAWLLLYELLDQGNHAALDSGVAGDPLVIDLLAGRVGRFIAGADAG